MHHSAGKTKRGLAGSTSTTPAVTMAPNYSCPYRLCKPAAAAICALVDGGKIVVVPDSPVRWPILVIGASATLLSMSSMLSAHLSTYA
jgi:hypothetical protein